jgi:hypothetical protein
MPALEPAVVLATLIACLVLFVTDALRYELVRSGPLGDGGKVDSSVQLTGRQGP